MTASPLSKGVGRSRNLAPPPVPTSPPPHPSNSNFPARMHDAVPVSDLLRTVFESILEVFVLCLAGLLLARAGITDKATQRKLNRLNISLFTPCLLFSKVAFSLSPQKIKELWIVPLGFIVVTGTSMGVAWAMGTVFRLKKSQKAFAMAASGFMNSNSLPIALMQSLVVEVPGLKWDSDDTREAMLGRALTYLVLYSTLGMMLRWSFGVRLLTMADDDVAPASSEAERGELLGADRSQQRSVSNVVAGGASTEGSTLFDEPESTAANQVPESLNGRPTKYTQGSSTDDEDPWKDAVPQRVAVDVVRRSSTNSSTGNGPRRKLSRRPSDFHSFPNSPTSVRRGLPASAEDDEEAEMNGVDGDNESWEARLVQAKTEGEGRLRRGGRTLRRWAKVANEFMTVPMWSALISIAIAMVPPVQHELAKLRPIRSAIKSSGACSIPITLIVLGAYFYGPDKVASEPPAGLTNPTGQQVSWWKRPFSRKKPAIQLVGDEGEEVVLRRKASTPGEKRTIFVAVVSRMIITPLILIPVVALLAVYDPFEVAEDPVFIATAVLVISSPPAITLAQITQASSGDAFESLISKTIWISYGILTPPLTLGYVVCALYLSRF